MLSEPYISDVAFASGRQERSAATWKTTHEQAFLDSRLTWPPHLTRGCLDFRSRREGEVAFFADIMFPPARMSGSFWMPPLLRAHLSLAMQARGSAQPLAEDHADLVRQIVVRLPEEAYRRIRRGETPTWLGGHAGHRVGQGVLEGRRFPLTATATG